MDPKQTVTPSEWKIMELLWANGPQTMAQLTAHLSAETGWSKHAVISLLKRMCQKGSAAIVENTSPMQYQALLPRQDAVAQETQGVLAKVFHGKSALMIHTLVEDASFSDEEIDELMALLESRRK